MDETAFAALIIGLFLAGVLALVLVAGLAYLLFFRRGGRVSLAAGVGPAVLDAEFIRTLEERSTRYLEEVAERKRAEEALREATEKFRQLAENIREVFWMTDLEPFRMTYVSPAYAEIWGRPAEAALGAPAVWHDAVHPEDRDRMLERLEAMRRGEGYAEEYRIRRPDGSVRWIREQAFPVRGEDGAVRRIAGVAEDVTERKEAEARQAAQADRLAAMGRLAAGVAHEINNPLTYILQHLDVLRNALRRLAADPAAAEAERRRLFEDLAAKSAEAAEGAQRIRQIVKDLKTYSRDDEMPAPVDCNRVVEYAAKIAANEMRYRARLVKDLREVPPVLASDVRLSQVFLNLLVNAAHAIPEGEVDRNEIRVRSYARDGEVVVEVSDTGCGIPDEIRGKIFDPFFTTKPVGVGTGLGLPVCKNLVEAAGGSIEVESEVGRGSTFRVRLPAAAPQDVGAAAPAPPSAVGGAGPPGETAAPRGRILVIDDEPLVRSTVEMVLGLEHDVASVSSGAEALDLLRRDARWDLVLCDLMMPEMSGMEIHDSVRAWDPALADRIAFMTGGAFTESARTFVAQIPERVLEKPFDAGELAAFVRGRLARAAA